MKVVIASSGLGHVDRGIESWAADLGRGLADRGEPVTLCKGGGSESAPIERLVPCLQRGSNTSELLLRRLPRRLSWRFRLGSGYDIEQVTFALGLIRELRRCRADLLHVQDPTVALMVQRAWQAGLIGTRVILAHGTEEPPSFLKKIKYLQHLAPWHDQEVRAAGVWRPTWTTIPNFIDTDRFRPGVARALRAELGLPDEGIVVLSVAAIKRSHKRVDHLISEFTRLRELRPDLPAYMIIAGGREPETDNLIAEGKARLGPRLRILVGFPRSRMPELYRAADLFVLSSLREMMPMALLEAMASGLPCLVHHHPLLRWVVGPGGRGIDMATQGALASALLGWMGNPPARRRLGWQARRHCLESFSMTRVIDQILAYYHTVLGHGRAISGGGEPSTSPLMSCPA